VRESRGFTLLEVLIATTLLAVMALLLTGSLRVGAGAWEKGEATAERASRILLVQRFLRTQLESALPLIEQVEPNRSVLSFRGTGQGLEYVAALSPFIRGGLYRFRLYLAPREGSADLRLALQHWGSERVLDDIVVLERVEALRIAYLSLNEQTREWIWLEEWHEMVMPKQIRITLKPEGEEIWPPLFVAPRIEALR
jgi:general secretion pathway protein J